MTTIRKTLLKIALGKKWQFNLTAPVFALWSVSMLQSAQGSDPFESNDRLSVHYSTKQEADEEMGDLSVQPDQKESSKRQTGKYSYWKMG